MTCLKQEDTSVSVSLLGELESGRGCDIPVKLSHERWGRARAVFWISSFGLCTYLREVYMS